MSDLSSWESGGISISMPDTVYDYGAGGALVDAGGGFVPLPSVDDPADYFGFYGPGSWMDWTPAPAPAPSTPSPFGFYAPETRPASIAAIPVDPSELNPIVANGDSDLWGSILNVFGKFTDAGVSIFKTVSTLDTQKQLADVQTQQNLATIERQSKLDDANTALRLAQLQYAAGMAARGTAPAPAMNWNLLLLGGAVLGGVVLIARKKRR